LDSVRPPIGTFLRIKIGHHEGKVGQVISTHEEQVTMRELCDVTTSDVSSRLTDHHDH